MKQVKFTIQFNIDEKEFKSQKGQNFINYFKLLKEDIKSDFKVNEKTPKLSDVEVNLTVK